jgi:hypothetical protein
LAIRYIRHKDINFSLWDRCINNSLNGMVYANSWYLDIVAESWDALVEDDYRSVMPLIYQKRYIYKKLFTPFLSHQLGIFSMKPLTAEKIEMFLDDIPVQFRKINICLNRQNSQTIKNCIDCKPLKSYELDLIVPYEKKMGLYSPGVNSGLSIVRERKLSITKSTSLAEFLGFIMRYEKNLPQNILLNPIQQIMSLLISTGKGEIFSVYGSANNLISVACFVRSNQNVILLYALSNLQGEEEKANYMILDTFLQNYSSRNVTLSIDHLDNCWNDELYRDFDALESYYLCYRKNRLPLLLKWI